MSIITNQLRDEIGELNKSKGWYSEPRSIAQHCILLHSEVSEIVEDYRNNKAIDEVWYEYDLFYKTDKSVHKVMYHSSGDEVLGKPCGIPSELADVVIRALDMAYEYKYNIPEVLENEDYFIGYMDNQPFEYLIGCLHDSISSMFRGKSTEYLPFILLLCIYIANRYNINLEQQILDKLAYNRTRPARHGNKRL